MLQRLDVRPADARREGPDGARRLVSLGARREWWIRERTHPATGEAELLFESHDIVRVVRRFPPAWRALTDDELERLSLTR